MIFRRATLTVAAVSIVLAGWNRAQGQLDVVLSVDVNLSTSRGIYTYDYFLENTSQSSQSINSILLSTGLNAPVVNIKGPNDHWLSSYAPEEEVFQAGFATGLSADGADCGVTDEFDLFQGQTVSFQLTSPWAPAEQPYALGRTVGRGAACDFVGDFATGTIATPSLPIQECDFDRDGACGLTDIDALAAAIAQSSTDAIFDLNLDTAVNRADLDLFLALSQRINGDADFNGRVEFADFLVMSGSFAANANWSQGDFDGTGRVAFADFLILSGNFGQSSGALTALVPEPAVNGAFVIFILFVATPRGRASIIS